jgi:hypothetical protein
MRMILVLLAFGGGTALASAQTGDELLDRYQAGMERCELHYRQGMERLADQPPNHSNTRRSRDMIENNFASCKQGVQHGFERAQQSQQRRKRY